MSAATQRKARAPHTPRALPRILALAAPFASETAGMAALLQRVLAPC